MALLFFDGYDYSDAAGLTYRYVNYGTGVSIGTSGQRFSYGQFLQVTAQQGMYKQLAANSGSTIIIGFALRMGNNDTNQNVATDVITLNDGTTVQTTLSWALDGTLTVKRGSTTLGSTAAGVLPKYVWKYIELKIYFHSSAGTVDLKVDGTNVLSLTAQNTKASANAYMNRLYFIGQNGGGGTYYNNSFDDLYLVDTTGASNNDFLGDCKVQALVPTSDGAHADFTCSTGSSHYALVDEKPENTTDYNSSDTAGKIDTFGFQDLSISGTVAGVNLILYAKKDDSTTRTLKNLVRQGGVDYPGTAVQTMSTTWQYYLEQFELNPSTSAAWTTSDVNTNCEFGYKVNS